MKAEGHRAQGEGLKAREAMMLGSPAPRGYTQDAEITESLY